VHHSTFLFAIRVLSITLPQGLLSDGLLAWRCYVLWGSRRWLKWALTFMVCADACALHIALFTTSPLTLILVLGLSSNFAYGHYLNLLFQRKGEDQLRPLECLATALLLAWVWVFFAINTVMTTSIIGKIAYVARSLGCASLMVFLSQPCHFEKQTAQPHARDELGLQCRHQSGHRV
jgi:hypothetical protein